MEKPSDFGKYTLDELEAMDLRDLYALTESWSKVFSIRECTEEERDITRKATRIYIIRREHLRRGAAELLAAAKHYHETSEEGNLFDVSDPLSGIEWAEKYRKSKARLLDAIAKAEGE